MTTREERSRWLVSILRLAQVDAGRNREKLTLPELIRRACEYGGTAVPRPTPGEFAQMILDPQADVYSVDLPPLTEPGVYDFTCENRGPRQEEAVMIMYEDTNGNEVMFAEEFVTPDVEKMMLFTAAPKEHEKLQRAFAALHEQEDRLLAGASAQQHEIRGGNYCRTVVTMPGAAGPLTIYGQVMTIQEMREKERLAGASPRRVDQVMKIFADGRKQGWAYGIWFSVAEPEGDLGAHHIGTLEVITREEFETARAAKWT